MIDKRILRYLQKFWTDYTSTICIYLGLKISAVGLQPVEEKINAVKKAPTPRNVSELRSFLGMVQYYHSFLPRLATMLVPLHKLLQKGVQ